MDNHATGKHAGIDQARQNRADDIIANVTGRLVSCGLDLVQAFDIAHYNRLIAGHEDLEALPQFGRQGALGLLVGNTGALWPRFIDAFHGDRELQASADPLDDWIERMLTDGQSDIPVQSFVRFSHQRGQGFVSMLHLAQASGLAHVGPAHLAVHRDHGPWIGLRAVVVVDAEPPEASSQESAAGPCEACEAPCTRALESALAAAPATQIAAAWQAWVAIRDACPLGRASRYSAPQLRYHYTRDPAALVIDPSTV